ncbi:hypothetical protein [Actinomadura macrotermitis]|uniref:hypothetical protein n=1 Tax=Actinomadura macrotermitis TaxID=2585200 RepID=UPI001F415A98|nr:hypothetical protein [Actinomadura macrotermitis]
MTVTVTDTVEDTVADTATGTATGTAPAPAPADPGAAVRLAERVAGVAAAVPDVAALAAGPHNQVVTYRPGPPLTGVAIRPDEVEIGVVARFGRPLPEIADEVRTAVRPWTGERPVTVLIADITDAGD